MCTTMLNTALKDPHPGANVVLQLVQVGLDVVGLVLGIAGTGGGILGGLLQLMKRRTQ